MDRFVDHHDEAVGREANIVHRRYHQHVPKIRSTHQAMGSDVDSDKSNGQRKMKQKKKWYGRPNGASNDKWEPNFEIEEGYPVMYTCADEFTKRSRSTTIKSLTLSYGYTVELGPAENGETYEASLRILEWKLLWGIVQDLGIDECRFDKQEFDSHSSPTRRYHRQLADHTYVVGLDSREPDALDLARGLPACLAKDEENTCVRVKGIMTAAMIGDNEDEVEDYLLGKVSYLLEDEDMLRDNVKRVRYVGVDDTAVFVTPTVATASKNDQGSGSGGDDVVGALGIGMIASALVFFVAVLVLFVRVYSLKRRDATDESEEREVKKSTSVEIIGHIDDLISTLATVESGSKSVGSNKDDAEASISSEAAVQIDGALSDIFQPAMAPSAHTIHAAARQRRRKLSTKKRKRMKQKSGSRGRPQMMSPIAENEEDHEEAGVIGESPSDTSDYYSSSDLEDEGYYADGGISPSDSSQESGIAGVASPPISPYGVENSPFSKRFEASPTSTDSTEQGRSFHSQETSKAANRISSPPSSKFEI